MLIESGVHSTSRKKRNSEEEEVPPQKEKKTPSKNGFKDLTRDLVINHLVPIGDYVASCITFTPPNRVPAGNEYHVWDLLNSFDYPV